MIEIHPLDARYRTWADKYFVSRWGATSVVSRGVVYDLRHFPGFVALHDGEPAGVVTYRVDGDECEMLSLNSVVEERGIGAALLEATRRHAQEVGCRRIFFITTNDNLNALRFFQKRGYRLAALHAGAVDEARRIKPGIPLLGSDGIPLHDEIELEMSW